MNILLINHIFKADEKLMVGGVEYHRLVQPHKVLMRHYKDYDVVMAQALEGAGEEILKQTDLVIFSRTIPEGASERLNELNIPFALDLDDWWELPKDHIAYQDYIDFDFSRRSIRSIREAHFVICTTPILAEKIKEHNANVYVIENGIDSGDEVWQPRKTLSDRLRFGFTQGNTHIHDIKSIAKSVSNCFNDSDFYHKGQIVLCGFYGEDTSWKNVTIEQIYELMLTDYHRGIKFEKDYVRQLLQLNKIQVEDSPYIRKWGVHVDEFGYVYDSFDVCVAPLLKSEFNSCKSELKMLEAGFKDCAIMLNHNAPYTLLATDENSFDLNKKTFREWVKILLKNPNLVADTKAQLRLDIDKYDLKHLSVKRNEIYQKYKKK